MKQMNMLLVGLIVSILILAAVIASSSRDSSSTVSSIEEGDSDGIILIRHQQPFFDYPGPAYPRFFNYPGPRHRRRRIRKEPEMMPPMMAPETPSEPEPFNTDY